MESKEIINKNAACSRDWTRDEAIEVINNLWESVVIYGYYIALTGSVLRHGYSRNDLDIVLYPDLCHQDYREALEMIRLKLNIEQIYCVEFNEADHKLVYQGDLPTGHRINIMIPNFSMAGRLDKLEIISNIHGKSGGKVCQ